MSLLKEGKHSIHVCENQACASIIPRRLKTVANMLKTIAIFELFL